MTAREGLALDLERVARSLDRVISSSAIGASATTRAELRRLWTELAREASMLAPGTVTADSCRAPENL